MKDITATSDDPVDCFNAVSLRTIKTSRHSLISEHIIVISVPVGCLTDALNSDFSLGSHAKIGNWEMYQRKADALDLPCSINCAFRRRRRKNISNPRTIKWGLVALD